MQESKEAKRSNKSQESKLKKPATFTMAQSRRGTAVPKSTPATEKLQENYKTQETRPVSAAAIAECAFFMWQEEGCPSNSDKKHWYRAESLLKASIR